MACGYCCVAPVSSIVELVMVSPLQLVVLQPQRLAFSWSQSAAGVSATILGYGGCVHMPPGVQ
jgi:hypothetical protein